MKSQRINVVVGFVLVLFLSFLFTSVANAGGNDNRLKRKAERDTRKEIERISKPLPEPPEPPEPPPKKEYEIVVGTATVLPSKVIADEPWPTSVIITLKVREKRTGVFVPFPRGTEISFEVRYLGGDGEGGEIIPFPPDKPYVLSEETMEVTFIGPQIVSKTGNKHIASRPGQGFRVWTNVRFDI